jgi:gas vesicle protein
MNRNASNVLVGLLLGAVAGGVTALLLAPASGEDTRKKIKDTLRKGKERIFDEVDEAKDFAQTHKEALKEAVIGGKEAYLKAMKKGPAEAST